MSARRPRTPPAPTGCLRPVPGGRHTQPPAAALPGPAPRLRPLTSCGQPGWLAGAAEGRAGVRGGLGPRRAPCVVRLVPARRRRRRRATSGSVQRVCLQRAGRAGRARARARARRRAGLEAVSAALSRAPCLPLAASAETAPARTALGAARPGAAASLPAPAPQELPELLDRKEPSRGLRRAGQERRRRFSPCWPGRPSLPVLGPSLPSPLLSASSRAASLGLFFQTV